MLIKFGDYLEYHFVLDGNWKKIIKNMYVDSFDVLELNNNKMFSVKTLDFVVDVLAKKLQEIYDYDLIYDSESRYLQTKLLNILSFGIYRLCNEFKILTSMSNKDLDNEIKKSSSYVFNTMGYDGFDLENQDGAFQKNSSFNSVKDGNIFSFLSIIQRKTRDWGDSINLRIKKELCRVIY